MGKHILVIGATLMDAKGKPLAGLQPGTSNPANVRITRGGTARNVAENLGRLGADVILISAVGHDLIGDQLLAQTADAHVNVEYVLQEKGYRTGAYLAVLEDDGLLSVALDDVSVMQTITSGLLYRQRRLFRDASLIMMDGSLSPDAMNTIARLALQYGVKAANYPLTEEDLDKMKIPDSVLKHRDKVYGLTIDPFRLSQIRSERRAGTRYSNLRQCQREVSDAEALFLRNGVDFLSTTDTSIEEISGKVLLALNIHNRLH